MAEESKDIEKKEAGLPEERSRYDSFVQDAVTRKYQGKRGDPKGRYAHTWVSKPEPGSEAEVSVHSMGDPDTVQEIGEALGKAYDYHGHTPQPMPYEVEAEVVGGELAELYKDTMRQAPHALPRFHGKLKALEGKFKLPSIGSSLVEKGDQFAEGVEAGLGLNEALEGFEPKFEKQKEEKGGK